MRTIVPLLFAALLATPSAAAPFLDASQAEAFAGLRGPIKFTVEQGPGSDWRKTPRGLSDERLEAFVEFLRPGGAALSERENNALLERVAEVLAGVDLMYKSGASPEEWERRLEGMRSELIALHGEPQARRVDALQWEAQLDGMLRRFVASLGDPHSRYLDREEGSEFSRGVSVGLGVYTERGADGLLLRTVLPDTPAERAGLRDGDVILSIDGRSLSGLDLRAMREALKKPQGQAMELVVRRGENVLRASAARAVLPSPSMLARLAAPGVGYVHFAEFERRTDEELFEAIDGLVARGARALVLDLRGNPGGYVHVARSIASEFLEDKELIDTMWRRDEVYERARVDGRGRYFGMPVAVLVDGGSASASEMLAAALQDLSRAVVIGSQSYGKGTFQGPRPTAVTNPDADQCEAEDCAPPYYPDGTVLVLTEGKWTSPRGRWVQGRYDAEAGRNIRGSGGVVPDRIVAINEAEEAAVEKDLLLQLHGRTPLGIDRALQAALEALPSRG